MAVQNGPAQTVPQTGSIEGRVTDAGNGTVLGGVEILLSRTGVNEAPLLVTTDQSGRFTADDLEPGRYRLAAQRDGYVSQEYGERARNRQGILLALARGQTLTGIDFRLLSTGVITGHVFGEGNEPRIGTTVAALSLHYVHDRQQLVIGDITLTNDHGEYRLFGLRPDRYFIAAFEPNRHGTVRLPKGAPPEERYGISFYPNMIDASKASTINVQPGNELNGADIYLARHRTFHVHGWMNGSGRGAYGQRVQIQPLLSGTAIGVGLQETTPDERGVFDFGGLPPGQYVVTAMFSLLGKSYRAWLPVEIEDSDVSNLLITPNTGIDIQGRMQFTERKEVDLRSVALNFRPTFSTGAGVPPPRSSADGNFTARLNADIYNLEISALPEDCYVESVRIFDQESSDRVVDLTRFMSSSTRLDITLNANGGHIDGAVENDKHEPIAGATVLLVPEVSYRKQTYLFRSVNTDRSGRFSIRGIVPGEYKLLAWEDVESGAWEDPEFLNQYEDRAEKLTIQPNGHETRNPVLIPAAVAQ